MQSLTVRELLSNLTLSLKKVFRVHKVQYFLIDKDTIDQIRKDGAELKQVNHAHQSLYALVPDGVSKRDYRPSFCFSNMTDVTKMQAITGKSFAGPILNVQHPDKVILICQMEIRPGPGTNSFDESRDRRAFEIIGKVVSGILERIFVNARTSETHDRAYIILKTCKYHCFELF